MMVGLFAGMTQVQLQAALATAQAAYLQVASGNKVEVANYTQGDGAKSITYTRTNIGQLTALIAQLQAALGLSRGRRSMRFLHR